MVQVEKRDANVPGLTTVELVAIIAWAADSVAGGVSTVYEHDTTKLMVKLRVP